MKGPCTVGKYLAVLTSKLTQYDQKETLREMKRGGRGNIYRLGHYLGASQKVEDKMRPFLDSADPAALQRLRETLMEHFTFDYGRDGEAVAGLPPVRAVLKQMAAGRCNLIK